MSNYEKKYKEALTWMQSLYDGLHGATKKDAEHYFPELKESVDERMLNLLKKYVHYNISDIVLEVDHVTRDQLESWLEKQGKQNQEHNFPKFNFDDILAIQCCMKTAEKVTEDKELYEKLKSLHSRLHDAYWLEKQGEQKQDPCDNCKDVMLNCHNFPCIKKRAFKQGKSVLEAINEEKIDNQNCAKPVDKTVEEYNITGIGSKHAQGKLGEMIKEIKSTDKVEPKFHEGEWVVTDKNNVVQIKAIKDSKYVLENTMRFPVDYVDKCWRKWTIQDAKDGDVLINWNNTTFIFKAIEDETVKFHIAYNENWDAIKTPSNKLSHLGLPEPQFEFHPATKEQRDQLKKAMADAGYTFDFEKKELKKIEKKPACSEEDEGILDEIIDFLENGTVKLQHDLSLYATWLKSLKDRYTWKPSDEQIKAVRLARNFVTDDFVEHQELVEILIELEKQLKKLK